MTPDQAATALRQGQVLNVDVDTGEAALALTVPYLFRHIDPTQTNGSSGLSKFRKLCDNAGLPGDHPALATWLAIRALRIQAGDALVIDFDCPIAIALASALGAVRTSNQAHVLRNDRTDAAAISITTDAVLAGETGAIATPAGTIRIPGTPVSCGVGSWATALTAIDKVPATLARKAYDSDPDATVELDYVRPEKSGTVDADSIHEDWNPEIATHADLKAHPARLIQSATLATVTPPAATYRPRLTRRVISSGFVSDAQFEFVVAAGEAHSRHLPADPETGRRLRTGIYLADGTGAGKTNEILATVLDNVLRGRKKAIIVLSKRRHRHGFLEAWARMGRDRRDFIFQWDLKNSQQIRAASGIVLTTYSALRDYDATNEVFLRVQQLRDWAGDDFQGVLAFDEAQDMRNAAGGEDQSGKSVTSIQGLAGLDIQDKFPDARVIYASATGATDVHNLAYAVRLGLWGEGTCFKDRQDFIKVFEEGGIADLEQVTLSLKAAGVYMARSLSFEGVETTHLAVTLTKSEREIYNRAAEAWGRLWDAFHYCARLCNVPLADKELMAELRKTGLAGSIPYSNLNGVYESNRKNSMATLIAAFKARAVIADAKQKIENGHAVVIQMQNTYEAQLDRALNRLADINDIRLEPAELMAFAESLPVVMYDIVPSQNEKGEEIRKYVMRVDANGDPVINWEAEAYKNTILADVRQIKLPLPPLDQIMLAFGPGRLAEVTGRTKRLVPNKPNGDRDGATGVLLEDRTETQRMADIEDFHNGKKLALVFSTGAGGASLSYHAKKGSKNPRRRIHYVIQLGYRADEVTQGFGRTHRSDQVEPPILSIVSCDLPADRLYASRIVSALFKLGALTQGHRHATSNGMFDERDCLDGPYAVGAWDDLQADIMEGLIPDYSWEQFMRDLGLNAKGEEEYEKWGKAATRAVLTNINRMINRVAALTDRRQDLIFEHLRTRIDSRIEKAIAEGTFNAGPEILKATSLEIISEKLINQDPVHGAATRLLRIRKKSELATNSFADAYRIYMRSRAGITGYANFSKHRTTGQLALIASGKPLFDMMGRKIAMREIITPTSTATRPARVVDREPWIPATDMDLLEGMWNAAVEAAPTEATSYVTIVADALLPIWKALRTAASFRNAVYRLQTDKGEQIVGRPIDSQFLDSFCDMIEISAAPTDSEIDEILAHLKNGSRVAVASRSKAPHFLAGTFTGSKLTGVELELGANAGHGLSAVLDLLPGGNLTRAAGTVIPVAQRAGDIVQALRAVMSCAPALYVEEDVSAKAQATVVTPAPAMAGQAMQQMAA
jgi:hypothetical protein